jgi:hypothetical protein
MGVVSLLCCDKAIWLGCEVFCTGGKYVWPYDGAKTGRGAAADSILVRDVVVESLTRQFLVKWMNGKPTILCVMILATDGA